ncbi:MAG: IS110 family transposase [Acidimicrobiia bacterium]|nr:IS110 family transposase [Acidimicrobiia bacterium]
MIIGVDPHKSSHTATALDPATNTPVASLRVEATLTGYRRLLRWAQQFEDRRWAVEGARGLGRHLAQWLVARDEAVVDVPSTATARVRELSRGSRRKTDVIDAAAAASVAALHGDATPVAAEDHTTVFALLEERRANLAAQRVRVANQLHAVLRDLVPGGAEVALTAKAAAAMLRCVRPASACERARKDLAQDLVKELRTVDASLADIEKRMAAALDNHGSQLREVDGVGAVTAVRLIGRTGPASRFATVHAFATYAGVAPIEVASGERTRHRLSRRGDRQLNSAIHLVAVTQVRMANSLGREYFDKKIAEGKTRNEAMRCLKRRLANHLWRLMLADERRLNAPPESVPIAA